MAGAIGEREVAIADAATALRLSICDTIGAFLANRHELTDLRPEFWMALGRLQLQAEQLGAAELLAETKRASKALGAPGDFGWAQAGASGRLWRQPF